MTYEKNQNDYLVQIKLLQEQIGKLQKTIYATSIYENSISSFYSEVVDFVNMPDKAPPIIDEKFHKGFL